MGLLVQFKSFFKFLERNKSYTLINVGGLSVSLMFVLLIAVYTVQELSMDQFHENKDRIYIVGSEECAATGAAIAYKIKDRYPEVEKVCPVVSSGEKLVVKVGDQKWRGEFLFADSTFFDLFSFPLVEGDRSQALSALNYAVVSESFAKKLFGGRIL